MCLTKLKLIWLSLLVLVLALPVLAQKPTIEYGQTDELRGVTKIFVNTGVDFWQHEMIVKVLRNRLPDLEVVRRPEDADIHLRLSRSSGKAVVVKLIGGDRERVLLYIRDLLPPTFVYVPTVNYGIEYARPVMIARQFVRAYRWANS
jgi:hypothetical protein